MRTLFAAAGLLAAAPALADEKKTDPRLFELRIYTAAEGKLDALHARFRDHTVKLFEKHGMTNIGYWVPVENKQNKLYYVIAHKDKEARAASFKAFGADPDWQKAYKESEKDGPLTTKGGIESVLLTATDFSPPVAPSVGKGERVFELRIYTATKGNLDHLNARFRDHTVKLFEKHGMTNLPYFNVAKGEKDADKMLYYFLAHASPDAAKKSFDTFRLDPDWVAARKASEEKAGGTLTEPKGGVVSIFLKATDYSPTK
jgi:L-rhamnose mutarotase